MLENKLLTSVSHMYEKRSMYKLFWPANKYNQSIKEIEEERKNMKE